MTQLPLRPVLFQADFEQVSPDEADINEGIVEALHKILKTTYVDEGHAVRSVHAKSHGLLEAELTVAAGLPPELAQGAFASPGKHRAVMRFSTNPGDILDDKVSTPRGLAIKMLDVEGERLPGSENDRTQDFVLVNAPVFVAPDTKTFLRSLKLLAATTDRAPQAKQVLSSVLRGAESVVEKLGGESAVLKGMGGHPLTHILGETFYSVVPVLWGPYYAKLCVVPMSPELTALTDLKLDMDDTPDALREAVMAHFAQHGGEWEVRVQLATDPQKMPIEDATILWPEEESPYVTVGHLRAEPQVGWSRALSGLIDDGMAFSPWHGLAAHRPLGAIMRARKPAYEMSAGFRAEFNRCPIHEPR